MIAPSSFIPEFIGRKVLVVGDAILDVYEKGTTEKICREAPVPVVSLYERVSSCGGAANTAVNVAALGGDVSFLSVIGGDAEGALLTDALAARDVQTHAVIRTAARRTISKTRICASSNILVRVDDGDTGPIDVKAADRLLGALRSELPFCDAVILSDYGYGLFSDYLLRELTNAWPEDAPPLIVDAKQPERFRGLAPVAVKPNYEEAARMLGIPPLTRSGRVEQILAHGSELLECTGARLVAATIDMDGTVLFERGRRPYLVSCLPQPDKRTIGAGDSFIGALALAISAGAPPRLGVRLAAAAAAVVIGKDGTGICSNEELRAHFRGHRKRVDDMESLAGIVRELKTQNRRIVFTNGCFDILHRGHVDFLRQARALGDVLVVALNSDASIHRLKGAGRPVNTLEDRMEVLAGLEAVDFLVTFNEESPQEILRLIRPDVFAKGGTYSMESLPEAELVSALGGDVEIIPLRSELTTSRLIERIQRPAVSQGGVQSGQGTL